MNSTDYMPAKRRAGGRRRQGVPSSPTPPPPINRIASVTVQSDHVTVDILLTPGTVVTAVNNPDDNFFVYYSGGQTTAPVATIVGPAHVRMTPLNDAVDAPATWETNDDFLSFASGTFAGPYAGDVVFA